MRYIIDRKTNEHERYDGQNYDATKYRIVEADPEGWIKHEGSECPLPDDARCEVLFNSGVKKIIAAKHYYWTDIVSYRPILTEKVQEPEPAETSYVFDVKFDGMPLEPTRKPKHFTLLDRLKAAHKAAQQIPDLEAELREVLGSMGYDLVARSPFVEQNPDTKTHINLCQEDMSDWRNWREGDEVTVFIGASKLLRTIIRILPDDDKQPIEVKDFSGNTSFPYWYQIKWHSRPAKGEK